MSNTKSPETTSYRICKTINKEHLNGVITLIDFGNNKGIAVVYVSESRPKIDNPVWHVSTEFIEYDEMNKVWKTCFPHVRYNDEKQNWTFEKISCREEGPPHSPDEDYPDNGEVYKNYIKYSFTWSGEKSKGVEKESFQGEGTGTGGNSGE
jgi:hypothetical protein